jgi:hypothetical protein
MKFTSHDLPDPPKSLDLTDFDQQKLKDLSLDEEMVTENKLFKITRRKEGYVIEFGRSSVVMPGLFSAIGYMTH